MLSLLKFFLEALARFLNLFLFFSYPFLKLNLLALVSPRCQLLSLELLLQQMSLSFLLLFDDFLPDMEHFREILEIKLVHQVRICLFEILERMPLEQSLRSHCTLMLSLLWQMNRMILIST